jgi:Lar family restriction alleviation protein
MTSPSLTACPLPCPFCGGSAHVERSSSAGSERIYCSGCDAASGYRLTEAAAIAAWNARVPEKRGGEAEDRQAAVDFFNAHCVRADSVQPLAAEDRQRATFVHGWLCALRSSQDRAEAMEKENARLVALVEAAFRQGWLARARHIGPGAHPLGECEREWNASAAKAASEVQGG